MSPQTAPQVLHHLDGYSGGRGGPNREDHGEECWSWRGTRSEASWKPAAQVFSLCLKIGCDKNEGVNRWIWPWQSSFCFLFFAMVSLKASLAWVRRVGQEEKELNLFLLRCHYLCELLRTLSASPSFTALSSVTFCLH